MRSNGWLPRTIVMVTADVAIAIAAVIVAATIRRTVPIPFTREMLAPEKFPLVAQTLVPCAVTLVVALLTAGFYSRSSSPRHRPSLFVALPLQIALLAIASAVVEQPWPRSLLFGVPLLEAPLLLLQRRLLSILWSRNVVHATLIGPAAVVASAARDVRAGHIPGVEVAALVAIDEDVDDVSYAGLLSSSAGQTAVRSAECAIDLSGSDAVRIQLVNLCAPRTFLYAATIADVISSESSSLRTFGSVVLAEVRFDACRGSGALLKRAIDVVIGALACIVASPMIFLAALATVLDTGAPVFVRQERLGRGGRVFGMWKLRTMIRGSEAQPASLALDRDDRVTRVGKWLRRYRIDELPQFLNVVTGEMSLVGPRPEIPAISRAIEERIPGFQLRLLVRPGIAGLAQVESEYDQDPAVKLRYDLHYICTWTPLLDAELLARSIIAALSGRGV